MGNGDLTFQSPATYPVGLVADDIQVGDFNSDGLHDLIVGNVGEGSVSILLGNGNGTFQNDVKFGPVPTATGIMIGDIDGNGTLDAAVTNRDSESVSILFNRGEPGNDAPILAPIGDRSVNEEQLISFTVTVTDPDQPAQTLTYSLDAASLAAGMTITADGAFAWTPTEAQGGAAYPVTITVTDNGTNPANLTDWETFTITVAEVNVAPVLGAIGNKSVDEQAALTFTASGDGPGRAGADADVQSGRGVAGGGDDDHGGRSVRLDADGSPGRGGLPGDDHGDGQRGQPGEPDGLGDVHDHGGRGERGAGAGRHRQPKRERAGHVAFTATATDQDVPAQTLTFSLDAASLAAGDDDHGGRRVCLDADGSPGRGGLHGDDHGD